MLNTSDIGSNMAVRRNKMIGFDPLRCDISDYTKGFFYIFELFAISVVKCYYASKWNKFSSTLTILLITRAMTLWIVGVISFWDNSNGITFCKGETIPFLYFSSFFFFFFKSSIISWFRLTIYIRLYNINIDIIYHIIIICHVFTFTNIYFLFFFGYRLNCTMYTEAKKKRKRTITPNKRRF